MHWSTKGKGNKGKRNKGKGECRESGHGDQQEDAEDQRPGGHGVVWSNKQRLYNPEHGQKDALATTERLRTDLTDLTSRVARMAGTMEEMQDRWYAREKAHTHEKEKDKFETQAGGK